MTLEEAFRAGADHVVVVDHHDLWITLHP